MKTGGTQGKNKSGLWKAKKMLGGDSKKAYFLEGACRPMWSVMRDSRKAGFQTWTLGVKLDPGRAHPEDWVQLTPTAGPQVLLHRATESLLLPLHGALDPFWGPLGRGQAAPPGPPRLCTGLPAIVLHRHELPGGWSYAVALLTDLHLAQGFFTWYPPVEFRGLWTFQYTQIEVSHFLL